MCLDEIQAPSFPDWITWPHQSAVNVAKLNFSTNVCHLQQSVETPNLWHKLAAQAHELGLPCVILELHFVRPTLCICPLHVCKYNVISHVCMYLSWKIKLGLTKEKEKKRILSMANVYIIRERFWNPFNSILIDANKNITFIGLFITFYLLSLFPLHIFITSWQSLYT